MLEATKLAILAKEKFSKVQELYKVFLIIQSHLNAVFLSRPDKSGRARISGHLGKITRITPGFL